MKPRCAQRGCSRLRDSSRNIWTSVHSCVSSLSDSTNEEVLPFPRAQKQGRSIRMHFLSKKTTNRSEQRLLVPSSSSRLKLMFLVLIHFCPVSLPNGCVVLPTGWILHRLCLLAIVLQVSFLCVSVQMLLLSNPPEIRP